MLDAIDFEHWEDEQLFDDEDVENKYRVKGANRDRKRDKPLGMILNGNGMKTVIIPLLGKKAREAREREK